MPRSACEHGQYLFPKFAIMLNLGNRCVIMILEVTNCEIDRKSPIS